MSSRKIFSAKWTRKDLTGLKGLNSEDLNAIFKRAEEFQKNPASQNLKLKGELAALIFLEASTRTRMSFEVAVNRLGGHSLIFSAQASSLEKGETLLDTVKNLEALGVRFFIIRNGENGVIKSLSEKSPSSFINAGDGTNEHPTQALLDIFTLKKSKGKIKGLKVLIVGDILHSRVARSNILALKELGAAVFLCGPHEFLSDELRDLVAGISNDLNESLIDSDAVLCLRIQRERLKEELNFTARDYFQNFGLTEERVKKYAKPDCVILHPGPLNREVEISSELADGPRSLILRQVHNGVFIRMAVLSLIKESLISRKNHG